MLSETAKEYKERANLYYKFFKTYFAEKEKEFQEKVFRNQERINFFKHLCKQILKSSNKFVSNMEEVSDTLFKNKLSHGMSNLKKFRKLIKA